MIDLSATVARQTLAVRERFVETLPMIAPSTVGPWELLLTLYTHESDGRYLTREDLAERVQMSPAILDRWTALLARQDMVVGGAGPDDLLRLTDTAIHMLRDVLNAAAREA